MYMLQFQEGESVNIALRLRLKDFFIEPTQHFNPTPKPLLISVQNCYIIDMTQTSTGHGMVKDCGNMSVVSRRTMTDQENAAMVGLSYQSQRGGKDDCGHNRLR